MVIASDYPFIDVFWTMMVFFAWIIWIYLLIVIFSDIFSRHDIGGWAKSGWCLFVFILPFLGVLVYLIAQHDGMAQRQAEQAEAMQKQFDDRVRTVAQSSGGAASEIDKAQQLLANGSINQAEFDTIKAKALAAA